jgi:hypothetical protein
VKLAYPLLFGDPSMSHTPGAERIHLSATVDAAHPALLGIAFGTQTCQDFPHTRLIFRTLRSEIRDKSELREQDIGRKFADESNPLVASVGSETKFSGLGKLETALTDSRFACPFIRAAVRIQPPADGASIHRLDEPIKELLPELKSLSTKKASLDVTHRAVPKRDQDIFADLQNLHESNPVLGIRGVRLGMLILELYRVQVRAFVVKIAIERARQSLQLSNSAIWEVNETAQGVFTFSKNQA